MSLFYPKSNISYLEATEVKIKEISLRHPPKQSHIYIHVFKFRQKITKGEIRQQCNVEITDQTQI